MSKNKKQALNSIMKGGAIVFLGTLGSKFLGLLYLMLAGRLGVGDYGVISLMISVFSAVSTVGFMGVHQGVQKYVAEYRGKGDWSKIRGTMASGFQLIGLSSVITGLLLFMLAPFLANNLFNEPRALWPIRMVAIAIPFQAFTNVLNNYSEAMGDMKPTIITIQIFSNLVKIIAASSLVALGFGYLGASFGFALAFIVPTGLAYYFYTKKKTEKFEEATPRKNYSEIIQHSWPLFAAGILGVITGDIDTFMLQSLKGTTEVGFYNAAYPLGALIVGFSGIFGNIFLSNSTELLARDKKEALTDVFGNTIKWINLLAVPIFLVVFAFPKSALILFGSEYFSAAPVLRVISLGFLINSLLGPAGQVYQSYGKTKLNLYTTALLATLNLILNYFLIKSYGTIGAAAATTLSFVVLFCAHYFLVKQFIDVKFFTFETFKVWIAGLISIGITYITSNILFGVVPRWFLIIDLMIFGALYGSLLLVLDPFETQEREILQEAGKKYGFKTERLEKLIARN